MGDAPIALRFSHVGLFVADMAPMVAFYRDGLGFVVTDAGRLGDATLTFLSRDPREHHQLVLVEGRPPGLPDRIVNQVSFRVDTLGDLVAFWRRAIWSRSPMAMPGRSISAIPKATGSRSLPTRRGM
jgi:catechol 2,3-dioxygenase